MSALRGAAAPQANAVSQRGGGRNQKARLPHPSTVAIVLWEVTESLKDRPRELVEADDRRHKTM